MRAGRWHTLVQWILAIPQPARNAHPWLAYWFGCAQLQTQPAEGIHTLERALMLFRELGDRAGRLECLIALLRGAFSGFHALDAMERWLDALLEEIDLDRHFDALDLELRVWAMLCVTLFHVRPWHPLTQLAYRHVDELLPTCTDESTALSAAISGLVVSYMSGAFDVGDGIVASTEALASRASAPPNEAAWWCAQVGYLRFVQARYEEALRYFEDGRRIAEANGLRSVVEVILLWRILVEFRVTGWSTASATLAEFDALGVRKRPMTDAMRNLIRARRAAHFRSIEESASLTLASDRAAMASGSRLEELVYGVTVGDLLIDLGSFDDAATRLTRIRTLIQHAPIYDCWRAVLEWLDAWLAHVQGDRASAIERLRESLALARVDCRRHYLRIADRSLGPLCCLALEERIAVDLVQDLICLFRLKPPAHAPDSWPWPVRIYTLGGFDVHVAGSPLEYSRKLPRKTLLLLKAIIALGGKDVPEQALCDALWSDEEGDAASNAFGITLVRLRKLLGSNETILQRGGRVSLNPDLCWIDAHVFEAKLSADCEVDWEVLSMYRGTFLPADQDEAWSVGARERLRGRFIHSLSMRGATLETHGDDRAALECYLRGIDADPIVESYYLGLMRCYDRLGKRTEALSAFRRLRHTLSVLLGVKPSGAAQRLFESLLGGQLDDPATEPAPDPKGAERPSRDAGARAAVVRTLPLRTRRILDGNR